VPKEQNKRMDIQAISVA